MSERTPGDEPIRIIDLGELGIHSPTDPVKEALDQEEAVEKQVQAKQNFALVQELLQDSITQLGAAAKILKDRGLAEPAEGIIDSLRGRKVVRWRLTRQPEDASAEAGLGIIDYDSTIRFQDGQYPKMLQYRVVVSRRKKEAWWDFPTLAVLELDCEDPQTTLTEILTLGNERRGLEVSAEAKLIQPRSSSLVRLIDKSVEGYPFRNSIEQGGVSLVLPKVLNQKSLPRIILKHHSGGSSSFKNGEFIFSEEQSESRLGYGDVKKPHVVSSNNFVQIAKDILSLIPTEEVK